MVGKITRNDIITASVTPSLMNDNPYQSRNDLLAQILAERGVEGFKKSEFQGNEATEWGNRLEPLILVSAAKMLGIEKYDTEITQVYRYRENFLEASLDGVFYNGNNRIYPTENIIFPQGQEYIDLVGDGCAESKNTIAGFTPIPPPYRGVWQLQAQMKCTNFKWGVIAILYGGNRLVLYVYEADKFMQDQLVDAIEDFYSRLDGPDYYPALDGADGARTYSIAEDDLPEINLHKVSEVVDEYVEAKKTIKVLQELVSSCEAQIMDEMGNHESAFLDDAMGNRKVEITWRMRKTKATQEKVIEAKPEKVERQKTLSIAQRWLK